MPDIEPLAVLAATLAAFVLGFVFYGVFGGQLAQVSAASSADRPPWQVPVVEVVRALILATVVAGVAALAEVDTWTGGVILGLVLWIGFPFVLWTGAMFHEHTPLKLAAIHAGDWLVKLLAIGLIVAAWP